MSVVVVGSVAFDTIKTPFGKREKSLGGAANYFSMAAKFFTNVRMVAVIGDDYPSSHLDYLAGEGVDISGVEKKIGKSFHWEGEYEFDLNQAHTKNTELNVFSDFKPILPQHFLDSQTVFLANIDPSLQLNVLNQIKKPDLIALDTMNFWIEAKKSELEKVIERVDILFINDAEIRQLSGEHNIVKAARAAQKMGAKYVVVKRGDNGSLLVGEGIFAFMPAYPLENVFDPTGAGDTFAGGFLGALENIGFTNEKSLRQALLMGTVMSSFVIEDFSFDQVEKLNHQKINDRCHQLLKMVHMPEIMALKSKN